MKESLNKYANCFQISFFRRNNILFEPETLLELRKNMMLAVSSLSISCWNFVLPLPLERESENCLCEYFVFFVVSAVEAK